MELEPELSLSTDLSAETRRKVEKARQPTTILHRTVRNQNPGEDEETKSREQLVPVSITEGRHLRGKPGMRSRISKMGLAWSITT